MTNAYPDLPVLDYERTTVAMIDVIPHIQAAPVDQEIQRAAYIMFRVEGANGTAGVNNNYIGMQADSGEWPASLTHYFAGTVTEPENGTGRMRIFLAFAKWQDCVDCLIDRVKARGLYIGGRASPISNLLVSSETNLVRAYVKEWAQGRSDAEPTAATIDDWLSMYGQAAALFRNGTVAQTPPAPQMSANTSVSTDDAETDALNAAEEQQIDQGTQT